mgnify:CR=1 FL=1
MQTNDFSNLPNSWQIKTLGEIYDITSSKRVFKDEWKTDGIPFYRARDLVSFSKNEPIKNPLFISETMYNEYSSKYGIPFEDDILVTGVGTIGIPYLVKANEKFYFKDGNILWFKKRASNIFSKYVYYLFLSNLLDTNSKGSTVLTYTIINAKNTKIPLPPLEIQKRIVARLESAFEKIEKGSAHLQDAKTKFAKYKQSLLKSAFDGTLTAAASLQGVEKAETIHKVDCHDLTSSKLAMTDKENPKLPQGWTIKTLGEVCEILDNMRKPINSIEREQRLKNSTTKYAYYGATGQVGYIDDFLCDFESILLGEDGAPFLEPFKDKAYIVSGKYWVNNHAHILKAKENFAINKFVCYFLNIVDYMPYVSGTTRLKLNQSAMKQIKIPLPPLETQKQIVKLLEKHLQHADKTGEFIESALNKAKQLKQSLLKSAFLGKLT